MNIKSVRSRTKSNYTVVITTKEKQPHEMTGGENDCYTGRHFSDSFYLLHKLLQ